MMSETTFSEKDLAEFGLAAYRACVYLDKAVPVAGRDNVERIRFAADEIVALRAEVARLLSLIERSNLEEVDGYEAQGSRLVKADRILVSKDLVAQEQRIAEALQTAAKHAREVARLREALAVYANHDGWQQAPSDFGNVPSDPYDWFMCDGNGWETAEAALAYETTTAEN